MKRFYNHVAITPVAGGAAVELDGRAVKTPARRPLVLSNRALAEAVAGEWESQGKTIETATMPMTRLATAAIDRVAERRAQVVDDIAAYGETDLICHRAAAPDDLRARQDEGWQPLLDWCAARFGARLRVTEGVIAAPQDSAATGALRRAVEAHDPMALAALHAITAASGSLVIALALAEGRIDGATAWRLSRIDESFQSERWGVDKDARAAAGRLRDELLAAARFLGLCKDCSMGGERGTA